jgi:tetratricopeptide (TPR) repeat protein
MRVGLLLVAALVLSACSPSSSQLLKQGQAGNAGPPAVPPSLSSTALPQYVQEQAKNAAQAMERGEFLAAIKLGQHLVDTAPGHAVGHMIQGWSHLALGAPDSAFTSATAAAKIAPNSVETHYLRGIVEMRRQRYADASTAFEAALRVAPKFLPALTNRALALMELDRLAEAEAVIASIVTVNANTAEVPALRGRLALKQRNAAEATKQFKLALAVDVNNPTARVGLQSQLAAEAVRQLSR